MKILAPTYLLLLAAFLQASHSQGQQAIDTGDYERLARNLDERHIGREEDSDGTIHVRKRQTINGIQLLDSEYIEHHYTNGETSITGNYQDHHSNIDTTPTIDFRTAYGVATDAVGGSFVTTESNAELVIASGDILAYHVEIHGICGYDNYIYNVIVNAENGSVLSLHDNTRTLDPRIDHSVTCIIQSTPSYPQATKNRALSELLQDDKKVTYNWQTASVGTSSDKILLNIHTFTQDVIEFSEAVMGFNPFNEMGEIVKSYGHVRNNYVNAYYNGFGYYYGDGDGQISGPLGVLDIVAHEMAHGVTDDFSKLIYYGESGAINEGFSDVFSAVVEAWVDGNKNSFLITDNVWYLGEDAWLVSIALRYMMSPSIDGRSKDHYSEVYKGSGDNGGVHYNSGIFNHFFYLLTVGGKHHNSKFHTDNHINGIGMGVAFEIVLKSNMYYFTSSTNYASARVAMIQACKDTFSDGAECDSVKNAWAEVGVGCVNDDQCKLGISSPCVITSCLGDGTCSLVGRNENCDPCKDDEIHVGIDITTDSFPQDTFWELIETVFNQTVHTYGQGVDKYEPRKSYYHDYCLPKTSCYMIDMYDRWGDGINLPGGYVIWADGVQIASKSGLRFSKDKIVLPCENTFETIDIEVDFLFDYYPQETSWHLTTNYMGETIQISNSSTSFVKENALQNYSETVSIYSRGCYDLYVTDAHGDGMCCDYGEGNFTVKVDGDMVLSGSTFGYSQHVRVGECPSDCADGEKSIKISINTDNFGSETHWYLKNSHGEVVTESGGTYASNSENIVEYCLPESDCYNFTITDDHGDGICCYSGNGNYTVDWDGEVVASGGEFGHYDSILFGNCSAPSNMTRSLSEQMIGYRVKEEEMNDGHQKTPTLRGYKLKDEGGQERSLTRGNILIEW